MLDQAKAKSDNWSLGQKQRAWSHHDQLVENMLAKEHWFETTVAGTTRDIRLVYSRSPFDEHVWTWPRQDHSVGTKQEPVEELATAVDVFTFSLADPVAAVPPPLPDPEASQWWRAHCTQSHLKVKSEDGSSWSSEALMNPDLHQLTLEMKRSSEAEQHAAAVQARAVRLQQDVNQQIRAIELQIELNTRMTREMALRKQTAKKRLSREQQAAVSIQRHVRGAHGRKKAHEIRCEFFVMVRGRAIRKGKCEECGAQPAVLQCKECEESVHFCPMCWVHVHSTRRRKMHVAIPMAAPAMSKEVKPSRSSSQRPRTNHQSIVAHTISFNPEDSAPVASIAHKSPELVLTIAAAAVKAESPPTSTTQVPPKACDSSIDTGAGSESNRAPKPTPMQRLESEDRFEARPSLKERHSALAKAREDQTSEANSSIHESETAASAAEMVSTALQPEHLQREERATALMTPQSTEPPVDSSASELLEPAAPTHIESSASETSSTAVSFEPQQEASAAASSEPVDPDAMASALDDMATRSRRLIGY